MYDALTTLLPVDGLPTKETTLNDEAKKQACMCNNGLVFLICASVRNYESIKTAATGT